MLGMDNIGMVVECEVIEVEVLFEVYCSDIEFKLVNFKVELVELDLKIRNENEVLVVSFFVSVNLIVSNLLFVCVRIVVWR